MSTICLNIQSWIDQTNWTFWTIRILLFWLAVHSDWLRSILFRFCPTRRPKSLVICPTSKIWIRQHSRKDYGFWLFRLRVYISQKKRMLKSEFEWWRHLVVAFLLNFWISKIHKIRKIYRNRPFLRVGRTLYVGGDHYVISNRKWLIKNSRVTLIWVGGNLRRRMCVGKLIRAVINIGHMLWCGGLV